MLWNIVSTIMLCYVGDMLILSQFGHNVQMLVIKALVIYVANRHLKMTSFRVR